MRIVDLLKKQSIDLNASVADKAAAIDHLVDLMAAGGNLNDKELYKQRVLAREQEGSTGIGEGIAIPHAKTEAVNEPGLASMIVRDGVDYESLDDEPAHLFFLIAAPAGGANVHLEVLSRLSRMLMDDDFRDNLMNAKTPEEYLAIIDKAEAEQVAAEEEEAAAEAAAEEAPAEPETAAPSDRPYVIGVTACPTGIAHTYMAAEALENKAAAMGVDIKIETNGSGGVKNHLTQADIDRAVGVIVACDKDVPVQRFAGKPVIFTKVANGIKIPEELIQTVLDGKAPIYQGNDSSSEAVDVESAEKESVGRQIYKHLMNGVSHMLPFVVGGGVLIALGFLIDIALAGNANAGGNFGQTNPVAAVIFWIGKAAFSFMIPILAGYIAQSIADRPGLLPGIVGGYLATIGATLQSPTGNDKAVSGFLGALLAGFVAGLLVNGLKKAFSWMPKSMDGIKPVFLYPLFGTVLIGLFMLLINPFVGYINLALSAGLKGLGETSHILLSVVLAAMMAIDMGGPFNKAAYVFGTASVATGDTWIMAAVMIGGMVPPIAIALSTTFNKKKWTKEELKSGPVNYAMGLCFITEGAIPYAASDPLRVIPSCMVGSAVAGLVCALFGCACPAPHGGVFTFAVVDHPLGYIVALVAGSVVGALMLALLKKNKTEKERA